MLGVNPEIQFMVLGDNGVLFHPDCNRLWVLNPIAATIWCLLPECSNEQYLYEQLIIRYGIDRGRAENDAAGCLAYLEQEGLLEGGTPSTLPERYNPLNIELEAVKWQEPETWTFETYFHTPGCIIHFVSSDMQFGEQFAGHLSHMQCTSVQAEIDARIALVRDTGKTTWSVFLGAKRYVSDVADDYVLPYLFSLLFVCVTKGLDRYFLLHGAVLEREGRTLILPGVAKSGKTTLTALLAAEGWKFYSDELVVLDTSTEGVFPSPLPMSIKPGSVDVLQDYYPWLKGEKIWDRADGQQVRYIVPPQSSLPDSLDKQVQPSVFIFPQYTPEGGTRLEKMSEVEALQRLAATGSSNRPLRAEDVQAMISLVERCPVFFLKFDDAAEATELIKVAVDSL